MFAAAANRPAAIAALIRGGADPSLRTNAISIQEQTAAEQAATRKWNAVLISWEPGFAERTRALEPKRGLFLPLSVTFNFPSNAAVALVASTVEDGRFYSSLNAVFTRDGGVAAGELAERLMKYSTDRERLGARGVPVVMYDPTEAARAFNETIRQMWASSVMTPLLPP